MAATITLMFAAAPGAANAAAWSLQAAPAPQVPNGQLSSVRCMSATSCMAVGSFTDSSGFRATLAERWNGTSWTRQTTPNPSGALSSQLSGVRCPSSTRCVAVGSYENSAGTRVTLAEIWNGTSWSIQPTPNPSGAVSSGLSGVTCTTTTACVAVGTFSTASPDPAGGWVDQMLVEHWNGSSWTIKTIPAPLGTTRAYLSGVACTSSDDCTAVGTAGAGETQPVVARWNGSTWSSRLLPNPSGAYDSRLYAITCTSSTACVAVGGYSSGEAGGPMTAHWNGSDWSIRTLANPAGAISGSLASVSCSDATTCTAVGASYAASNPSPDSGGSTTLAARWNGTRWTVQSTPNRTDTRFSWLEGVACVSGTACITVGTSSKGSYLLPLAEGWNGASWSMQGVSTPSGAAEGELNGVRCSASTACTAVGRYVNAAGVRVTLAERWNGTGWTIQPTPAPSGAVESWFNAVTCTSSTACTAVGAYRGTGEPLAFAARWNGTSWSIQPVPLPAGAYTSELHAVSCGVACTAVGTQTSSAGVTGTFAVRWNGTTWSVQSTANATAGGDSLVSVSCPSSTACAAVGSAGGARTLAERWNGTSWSLQQTANPSEISSWLTGVSCWTVATCTAVGSTSNSASGERASAQRWNGTSWSAQSVPTPSGASLTRFQGVNCPSDTSCVGVGSYINSSGRQVPMSQRWSGGAWSVEAIPAPAAGNSHLRSVSCPGTGSCVAVGTAQRTVNVPLIERYG